MSLTASVGLNYYGGYGFRYGYDNGYVYGYEGGGIYGSTAGGYGGTNLISIGDIYTRDRISVQRKYREVYWEKPKPDCFKLNTDGASKGNPEPSSCGGIIRDSEGRWIFWVSPKDGGRQGFESKSETLRSSGGNKLEVEVDVTAVLKLIEDRNHDRNDLQEVVSECRLLLEQFGLTTPKHVYCEANQCADILANYVLAIGEGIPNQDGILIRFDKDASSCVKNRMLADASGKVYYKALHG